MALEAFDALTEMAADVSQAERARMLMDAADRREAAAEEQERAERAAAAEAHIESLALADRQLGNPLGELSRARSDVSDAQDQVSDLRGQLERAEAKLASANSRTAFWAERLSVATESVQRSARHDNPFEAARSEANQAFRRHTQAMMRSATAGEVRRSRVPFAVVPDAVRGEPHEDCKHCRELGATEQESFAIHHGLVDPPIVPAMANGSGYCQHGYYRTSCAECRAAGTRAAAAPYGEITR